MDGLGWKSPNGVRYRAAYAANKITFVINHAKKSIQAVWYVLTEIQRSLLEKVLGMQDRYLERPTRPVKEVV